MSPEHASPCHNDLTALIRNVVEHPETWNRFSDSHLGDMTAPGAPNGTHKASVIVKVPRPLTSGQYNVSNTTKQSNHEVSIIKSLDHENVARYLGIKYNVSPHPAIVMTWYQYGDAPTFLAGRSRNERYRVIKGVLKGLCYLHDRSPAIAHGDIRGANILVNDSFEGVISGFTLSRLVGDGTGSGSGPGTKTYGCIRQTARELIHDEPGNPSPVGPTHASDVWAFGCLFYELMLGKVPYSSRRRAASIMIDIVRGTLPFSQEDAMRAGSSEIWEVVSRCWNPVPGDRPSAFELKNILYPLLG